MHPVGLPALTQELLLEHLFPGQRPRALQGVLGEPGPGQDLAHPGHVEVLTRVAGRGQREQLAIQIQAAAQHPGGLHRLVR